jgi:hypothetical protein
MRFGMGMGISDGSFCVDVPSGAGLGGHPWVYWFRGPLVGANPVVLEQYL